jgi:predicted nucleic-acid-binding protein
LAKGAWISHLVLVESLWVLDSAYDLPREKIVTAVDMLLNHREFTLQDADTVTAALAHFSGHIPLGTFDRDFAKVKGVQRLG